MALAEALAPAHWGTGVVDRLVSTDDNELLVVTFLGQAAWWPG
ncbi:hypothetical protein [Kitasatospora sp. NBC_00315]